MRVFSYKLEKIPMSKRFSSFRFYALVGFLSCLLSACSWSTPDSVQPTKTTRTTFPTTATQPSPNPPEARNADSRITSRKGFSQALLLQVLQRQLGRPYLYGGNSPQGFDCSGLVQYSFAQIGIQLPRSTLEQQATLTEVDKNELQAGDLVFFKTGINQYHVAIMLDQNNFIHAPSSGKTVSQASFSNPYWKKNFISAARY